MEHFLHVGQGGDQKSASGNPSAIPVILEQKRPNLAAARAVTELRLLHWASAGP